MKTAFKLSGAIFLILLLVNFILFYFYLNPYVFRALLARLSKAPQPGSCLILEEKYCQKGKLIQDPSLPNSLLAGFKVPKETALLCCKDQTNQGKT